MSTAVARNLMAEMKLLGMIESFDRLVTEATREQWSCTDFLDAMLQAESDFRGERKTKRRMIRLYAEHCRRSLDEVERTLDRDHFMSAEEALEWGLIDRILKQREDLR